jgi:hypothetical protein
MSIRPTVFAAILSLALPAFAQETPDSVQPTPPPSEGGVRVTFVPPPLDGTLSVGVYSNDGKLVRTLHKEATKKDFTVGVNGFITTWDGKDDAGNLMAPGKYGVRGWMVGELGVEGVAYHGNDWMKQDDSPRVVRAVGVKNVGQDEIHIWLEHIRGEQLQFSWNMKKEGQDQPKIDALAVAQGGKLEIRKAGSEPVNVALGEGESVVTATVGFGNTVWAIVEVAGMREVRAYSEKGEFLRRLGYAKDEPAPQQIAASMWSETIFLIDEGGGEQRVRALSMGPAPADAANPDAPKSTWKIVYFKRIVASSKFEEIASKLGRPMPFVPQDEVKIVTKANPLAENNAKAELGVKILTSPAGAVLQALDGLHLIHISDTPGLKWAVMGKEGDAITVFQGDGALVEEFKIGKHANLMAFDAGEYELKAKQ